MAKTDEAESTASAPPTEPVRRRLFDESTLAEAGDALSSVGWSSPESSSSSSPDGSLTSDDPFVRRIDESVRIENGGVGLDGLLNPAKVVNLERDLYNLRCELAALTGVVLPGMAPADADADADASATPDDADDADGAPAVVQVHPREHATVERHRRRQEEDQELGKDAEKGVPPSGPGRRRAGAPGVVVARRAAVAAAADADAGAAAARR
jgi:hypothetical protein